MGACLPWVVLNPEKIKQSKAHVFLFNPLLGLGVNINNMKSTILHTLLFAVISFNSFGQIIEFAEESLTMHFVRNTNMDSNDDFKIDVLEAAVFTGILDLSDMQLSVLSDIQYFNKIRGLDCSRNDIATLDVSMCTELTYLNCYDNRLTSLDVSDLSLLDTLNCSRNELSSINVSNNYYLSQLLCSDNTSISSLDVSSNEQLLRLDCDNNNLSELDISNNSLLTNLYCGNNSLTNLDVSSNPDLYQMQCYSNMITELDVSSNSKLISLSCEQNQLTILDVRNGNNTFMPVNFTATSNYLMCISVDDEGWANANWGSKKDIGTKYSENCTVGIQERQNIRTEDVKVIYDLRGSQLKTTQLENLGKGFYIIRSKDGRTQKVIKH